MEGVLDEVGLQSGRKHPDLHLRVLFAVSGAHVLIVFARECEKEVKKHYE